MEREKLVTVTIKDCDVQTFRCGGNGGQNVNKRETGVRIIHRPSGAIGECREERNQMANKRIAFKRMAESKDFQFWIKKESARRIGMIDDVAKTVDDMMHPKNLKVESKDESGRWVEGLTNEDESLSL